MARLLLLVEGQTEEAFANRVLRPHLAMHNVFLERASLLRTKELPAGKPYKGGVTTYLRMARDIRRLLMDSDATVTTLLDYYGIPDDFPGLAAARTLPNAFDRVSALQASFASDIGHPRFHPFLALHEFEAWILAAPDVAESHLSARGLGRALMEMTKSAGGPELVDDDPDTHPSVRLIAAVQRLGSYPYGKVADGPTILEKAGLTPVRNACPHFAQWLAWLESLGATS